VGHSRRAVPSSEAMLKLGMLGLVMSGS
jgi:hypothetical protein